MSFASSWFIRSSFFWHFCGLFLNEPRRREKREEGKLRCENYAFDAFFEDRNVEVDEKGEGVFGHFEIGDDLGFMDGS